MFGPQHSERFDWKTDREYLFTPNRCLVPVAFTSHLKQANLAFHSNEVA
jgi:hypothetical protein